MNLIFVIVVLTVLCYAYGGIYEAESCNTPNGYDGECIHFTKCPSISKHRVKGITRYVKKYIRSAKCGRIKNHLCCRLRGEPECYTPDGREGVCLDYNTHINRELKEYSNKFIFDSCCLTPRKVCYSSAPLITESSNCSSGFPSSDVNSHCCGIDALAGDKIVGGKIASLSQYPWLAVIKYKDDRGVCSGSLISAQYVLTAAHCVDEYEAPDTPIAVVLGEYDKSTTNDCTGIEGERDCAEPTVTIEIERILVHPNFSSRRRKHDIALIRLAKLAPFTEFIRPICLPLGIKDITEQPPPNFELTAAGWGVYDRTGRVSNVKLKVELPFFNYQECKKVYRDKKDPIKLNRHHVCAGGDANRDSCGGDSGGPLMYESRVYGKYELIGIVSFGDDKCGTAGIPGVYTKVFPHVPWIRNAIRPQQIYSLII